MKNTLVFAYFRAFLNTFKLWNVKSHIHIFLIFFRVLEEIAIELKAMQFNC